MYSNPKNKEQTFYRVNLGTQAPQRICICPVPPPIYPPIPIVQNPFVECLIGGIRITIDIGNQDPVPTTTYVGRVYGSNTLPVTSSNQLVAGPSTPQTTSPVVALGAPSPTQTYLGIQITATNIYGNSSVSPMVTISNPCIAPEPPFTPTITSLSATCSSGNINLTLSFVQTPGASYTITAYGNNTGAPVTEFSDLVFSPNPIVPGNVFTFPTVPYSYLAVKITATNGVGSASGALYQFTNPCPPVSPVINGAGGTCLGGTNIEWVLGSFVQDPNPATTYDVFLYASNTSPSNPAIAVDNQLGVNIGYNWTTTNFGYLYYGMRVLASTPVTSTFGPMYPIANPC